MKKGIVLVVVLVLALSVGVFGFQNEPDGFRGLKWGDPPGEDMQCIGDFEADDVAYFLPEDKMFLGDVELYLIGYRFYKERFMTVALYYHGEDNYDLLETICKERYGKEGIDEAFYDLRWMGQKSFVMLAYDVMEEDGYLILASTPLALEQTEAKKKEEAEKAEGDW